MLDLSCRSQITMNFIPIHVHVVGKNTSATYMYIHVDYILWSNNIQPISAPSTPSQGHDSQDATHDYEEDVQATGCSCCNPRIR